MRRHVILTLGRSGSNALVDMLNQHPEVLNMAEVLGDWSTFRKLRPLCRSERAYIDFVTSHRGLLWTLNATRSWRKRLRRQTNDVKRFDRLRTVGFKDFAFLFHHRGLENYLRDSDDIRVIGLIRENIFAKTISRAHFRLKNVISMSAEPGGESAMRTEDAASRTERAAQSLADDGRLIVDPDLFLEWLEAADAEDAELRAMLAALPADRVRTVTYEALFSSEVARQRTVSDLFEFLGVEDRPTEARMRKIITQEPTQLIANFDDCRRAAAGTRFAPLFNGASHHPNVDKRDNRLIGEQHPKR